MTELVVRRADLSDRSNVEAVCRAHSEEDYVLTFIDAFLGTGTVLLALDGDEPVGVVKVETALDGSGWLGALRAVPSRRREGIGKALSLACEQVSREAGSSAIRLWTDSWNDPAIALFEGLSYRRVGAFTRWWKDIDSSRGHDPDPWKNATEVQEHIYASSAVRDSNHYIPFAMRFCRVDLPMLERLVEAGALFKDSAGAPCGLDAEVWRSYNRDSVELTVLGDGIGPQVQAASGFGGLRGLRHLGTFLPYGERWASRARQAGLEEGTWGKHALLYEKEIRSSDGTVNKH